MDPTVQDAPEDVTATPATTGYTPRPTFAVPWRPMNNNWEIGTLHPRTAAGSWSVLVGFFGLLALAFATVHWVVGVIGAAMCVTGVVLGHVSLHKVRTGNLFAVSGLVIGYIGMYTAASSAFRFVVSTWLLHEAG